MTLKFFLVFMAAWGLALPARAQPAPASPPPRPILVDFHRGASSEELAAVRRWARADLAKARAAGRPAEVRAASVANVVILVLESVALCDRDTGCPILAFTDLTARPALYDRSFENMLYRPQGAEGVLTLRSGAGPDRECRLVAGRPASCHPVVHR
jgi:hypothetical protein